MPRYLLTFGALLFFAICCIVPSFAQTANQSSAVAIMPCVSPVEGGYKIVCSNFRWDTSRLAQTDLTFDFVVEHADGTPVAFDSPQGAIGLNGWTDSLSGQTTGQPSQPNFNQDSLAWRGRLTGIDPRNKVIHLQFLVRDPGASVNQSGNINSDFRLDPVSLPQHPDTLGPVSQTFTTVWGTTISLTGITYSTKGQYGQVAEQYSFTVDHSKLPDDAVSIQFANAFDNGVAIANLYPINQPGPSSGNPVIVLSSPIGPGSHTSASLDFTVQESSQSKLYSIKWTPVQFDIPIDSAWPFSSSYTANAQISTSVNKVQYRLVHIADPPGRDRFLVYAKSADPASAFQVTSASWGGAPIPLPPDESPLDIFNDIYWNYDHTPIAPGESGAFIRSRNGPSYYPLLYTVAAYDSIRQPISFSNIPIPSAGQTVILDQKPDKAGPVAFRLRSISYAHNNEPNSNFHGYNWQNDVSPDVLQLTFEYTISNNSTVSISLPPDTANAESQISAGSSPGGIQTLGTAVADPNNDTDVIQILLPPAGTKALNLKLILSKQTPVGQSVSFSISSDDKWTVLTPTK